MKVWFSVLAVLALAGCATSPAPAPVGNPALAWRARVAKLAPLGTWDVSGRMAVHTRHHGGEVSLRWVKNGPRYTIVLSGPLGRGLVRLTQGRHSARLEDSRRHVYQAASAQRLLFRATGWRVPLDALVYWIRGLPVPGVVGRQDLDDAGLLRQLHQLGWNIRFLSYSRYGNYVLPSDIKLSRVAAEGSRSPGMPPAGSGLRPVEARLVIERWAYLR